MTKSQELFERAKKCIPGGVNSPVRAFGSVGETPRFIKSAKGAYMVDEDDEKYIDYVCSWGPMFLGHNKEEIKESVFAACEKGLSFGAATAIEVEMAEFICAHIPSIEMVRMVNSGTEAVMSALRVARGFTGREKIIKFVGCYHGHSDQMLVSAGSGMMTSGVPDSVGVTKGCAKDTLLATYNDLESVKALFEANKDEVAALIIEPVAANMGVVPPKEGFLEGLRGLCDTYGALLIFDEVITGFRLGFGGAQERYGITPDLTTYGKIIGAGMPVGAYGGRKEVMEMVAPLGPVYQAGTLSGNPIAMAAGLTQLKILQGHPEIFEQQEENATYFYEGMKALIEKYKLPYSCNYVGTLGNLFFAKDVVDYESAKKADTMEFAKYFTHLLNHNIYMAPSQFEAMFISAAHTKVELDQTLEVIEGYFK